MEISESSEPQTHFQEWESKYGAESLKYPEDVALRVMVASLFHEIGDKKLRANNQKEMTKEELISQALDEALSDYELYSEDMKEDIISQIDLSSASKWGDRVPEGTKLYQLIVRWADRFEASGAIGVARCLTYGHSK